MQNDIRSRIEESIWIRDKKTVCKFPLNMLMEPTNMCNNSCLFCANSKCTKKRGFINRELAFNILEQAYKLGTHDVGFYGTGEPLLDQNLEDYITYSKKVGYRYVYITTNGALLSKERASSLIKAGIDSVKFSINASNARDYYLIHGKDEFNRVIENLIYFNELRSKFDRRIALYISYISTRYTYKDKEKFKRNYGVYVDDIIFDDCRNVAGCMANEIRSYLSVDQRMGYHPQNSICPMIFKNLYITYEGYLTMCCADFQNYLAIADLNKESLEEAWNNHYAQELRKRHLGHNLEGTLCYNCLNDCTNDIRPLNPDLAFSYDITSYSKEDEIKDRIDKWSLKQE